jgi:hypothetical protein
MHEQDKQAPTPPADSTPADPADRADPATPAGPAVRAVASSAELSEAVKPLIWRLLADGQFGPALRQALGDEPLLSMLQETARQTGVPVNMLGESVVRMAQMSLRGVGETMQEKDKEHHACTQ